MSVCSCSAIAWNASERVPEGVRERRYSGMAVTEYASS